MISYHQRPRRDMHHQSGAPWSGSNTKSQSANLTCNYVQQINMPHLPTVLEWYLSSVFAMYSVGASQYLKSDRGALNRIQDLQHVVFADLYLWDGPPGNWHTDGVTTWAPANAHWRSWTSMASFQASSNIKYLSLDNIGQGVLKNPITSIHLLVTANITFQC